MNKVVRTKQTGPWEGGGSGGKMETLLSNQPLYKGFASLVNKICNSMSCGAVERVVRREERKRYFLPSSVLSHASRC